MPGEGDARLRDDALALPRFRVAARARGEKRPLARMAATLARRDRLASDQRVGRYHQFHHLRSRPSAARVRRRQGARQSHRAARARWRNPARARWQALRARSDHLRDRRRDRRGIPCRYHGWRGHRLLGDDHRRADRIGALGSAQYRPDRPQARHQFGRPLPLRARGRPRLHAAGARACNQDGARSLRWRTLGGHGRGHAGGTRAHHRFSAHRSAAAHRPNGRPARGRARARPTRLLRRWYGQEPESYRPVLAR